MAIQYIAHVRMDIYIHIHSQNWAKTQFIMIWLLMKKVISHINWKICIGILNSFSDEDLIYISHIIFDLCAVGAIASALATTTLRKTGEGNPVPEEDTASKGVTTQLLSSPESSTEVCDGPRLCRTGKTGLVKSSSSFQVRQYVIIIYAYINARKIL